MVDPLRPTQTSKGPFVSSERYGWVLRTFSWCLRLYRTLRLFQRGLSLLTTISQIVCVSQVVSVPVPEPRCTLSRYSSTSLLLLRSEEGRHLPSVLAHFRTPLFLGTRRPDLSLRDDTRARKPVQVHPSHSYLRTHTVWTYGTRRKDGDRWRSRTRRYGSLLCSCGPRDPTLRFVTGGDLP